ncbi:cysteine proteinase [Laetiporus sulphureus 93-53]|uniref:Cysteine proteinase n=1 Tax=Laetiporus sulphureus 93-53 TaxID=1314785 RepID=A0A165H7Y9_9APHY|nr:cysteine proteinase [Laetiporus sulphureus 93-53]KZT11371.1 cysteine proteinase [Laetiporus sulphureus 93-53]
MAGSKRNRFKKAFSLKAPASAPATPPEPAVDDDDNLVDDLLAELDSRDKAVPPAVHSDTAVDKIAETPPPAQKQDSRSRHKARQVRRLAALVVHSVPDLIIHARIQARRAAALAEQYAPSNPEADARLQKEAQEEEKTIKRICDELGLEMYEITPDGHCLFSAVADQLATLKILPAGQATYTTCRHAAADYIHNHPDDFLPFLPSVDGEDAAGATSDTGLMTPAEFDRYCATMRDTGAWGGEPEILALSSAFNVPIHVIQCGQPPIVIHQPQGSTENSSVSDKNVVHISYHRRMYGLGEHYNSLRPKFSFKGTVKSVFKPNS